jgi:predicted acylesterase/phospholipase RssA
LYFLEIQINDRKYWDGGIMGNNPIFDVYEEAKDEWPDRHFEAIVSIGTGKPRNMNPAQNAFGMAKYMSNQLTNTERKHLEFKEKADVQRVYFQLNEEFELYKIDMADWQQLSKVEELARMFVASPEGKRLVDDCAKRVAKKRIS